MNKHEVSSTGSHQSSRIEFVSARWGGGAAPGKWHVYPMCGLLGLFQPGNDWSAGLLRMSCEAVVDDFGNLVRVQ